MSSTAVRFYAFVALFCLALAASTGVLLRFGIIYGMPVWAQDYTAVRHAHSHLMYFGWGTLGIMTLIWSMLPELTGRRLPHGVHVQMALICILSLLSFPAFWQNGYGKTVVGSLELPLGSMAAAINGLPWFLFMILYARATWRVPDRPLSLQLWDWACLLLLLASMGATAVGMQVALGVESAVLRDAALHLFLDVFAVGWFTLATLGLLWARLRSRAGAPGWLPTQSMAILLGVTFVLGMSPAVTPPSVFWIAAIANAAAALLLARHVHALWLRRQHLPALVWFALAALGIDILIAFVILIPGLWRWSAGTQLRVFFLHTLLLGWMSSALLGLMLDALLAWPRPVLRWLGWVWMVGVGSMLVALLGLGISQFLVVTPVTWLKLAAVSSIAPAAVAIVAALGMFGALFTRTADDG